MTAYEQGFKDGLKLYDDCKPFKYIEKMSLKYPTHILRTNYKKGALNGYEFAEDFDIKIINE